MDVDTRGNGTLEAIMQTIEERGDVEQYWECANVIAVERLGYNDHGRKHIEIVTQNALHILRLLEDVETPGIVEDYGMGWEDAEVVVALAALLHDVGHIIHRYNHSEYSLFLAADLLDDLLEEEYDAREKVIMKSEILHAIQSHHKKANPLTLEAGILRVADSLDMEKGRARGSEDDGEVPSIHSVSALSIEDVNIHEGEDKPIRIDIQMSNSSGIFQLDELARKKIEGSGLEDLIRLRAEIQDEEKKIVNEYEL